MSEKPKRKAAARPPISAHPAFPAIVALWFAALLGLGSLVLPAALFESLSEASGLSQFVVAAQPPLGATARLLIALAAAGLGALIGMVVARQVIVAAGPHSALRSERAGIKKPLSAHDELWADGIDAEPEPSDAPVYEPHVTAEADRAHADSRDVAGEAPAAVGWTVASDIPEDDFAGDPLDLGVYDEVAPFDRGAEPVVFADDTDTAVEEPQAFEAAVEPIDAGDTPSVDAPAPVTTGIAIVELVDRFARALQAHREHAAASAQAAADAVVDLTFSLGEKATNPARFEMENISDSGDEFVAEYDETSDDDDQAAYSSLLAMKSPFAPTREPVRFDVDDDESDEAEGSANEPVAIFPGQIAGREAADKVAQGAAPAAPYDIPGHSRPERALREALEKLQKLSGAA